MGPAGEGGQGHRLTRAAPEPERAERRWRALRRFVVYDRALAAAAGRRGWTLVLYEFVRFGVKQAWACLFGGAMLALLLGTHLWWPGWMPLARYDALTLAAVLIQAGMLLSGLETWEEARVILLFHVAGTAMEVFKTSVGSWIYPEPSVLRLGGVPLFTGFMYAAVGSYLARAWRVFDFRFTRHPPLWALSLLAGAAYGNFFLHHFVADVRVVLFAVSVVLLGRGWIHYRIDVAFRSMPLLLGLVLVTLFIWFAENLGTFSRAWIYPNQVKGWAMVGPGKLGGMVPADADQLRDGGLRERRAPVRAGAGWSEACTGRCIGSVIPLYPGAAA